MEESMRESLDEAIADSLQAKILVKSRHGALIKAAQKCADRVDNAEELSPALLTAMLQYIRALGLAPNNDAIDRRRLPKKKKEESALESMRKSFHVA